MVRLPEKGGDEREPGGVELASLSQEVKELVRLIATTDISELHVESGQVRIVIKRGAQVVPYQQASAVYTPPAVLPAPEASSSVNLIGHNPSHGEGVTLQENEQVIVAPMVGTFYMASSPAADPYVAEGDLIEPGQVVGIIEAMKMMNEIEAEVGGRVARVLVQNAQPVEYGQPLMVIHTA